MSVTTIVCLAGHLCGHVLVYFALLVFPDKKASYHAIYGIRLLRKQEKSVQHFYQVHEFLQMLADILLLALLHHFPEKSIIFLRCIIIYESIVEVRLYPKFFSVTDHSKGLVDNQVVSLQVLSRLPRGWKLVATWKSYYRVYRDFFHTAYIVVCTIQSCFKCNKLTYISHFRIHWAASLSFFVSLVLIAILTIIVILFCAKSDIRSDRTQYVRVPLLRCLLVVVVASIGICAAMLGKTGVKWIPVDESLQAVGYIRSLLASGLMNPQVIRLLFLVHTFSIERGLKVLGMTQSHAKLVQTGHGSDEPHSESSMAFADAQSNSTANTRLGPTSAES
jgi:hypothetical protein